MIMYQMKMSKIIELNYYEWIRQDFVIVIYKRDIIASISCYFYTGKSVSKDIEIIKERVAEFIVFKKTLEEMK